MKTFEQVLLESCTKTVYSRTRNFLTESIQIPIIQNLYSEGIRNWFLSKVRRLKMSLYYNKDRNEITNATIDTFFIKKSNGRISVRKEIVDSGFLRTDPQFRQKLVSFMQQYNKTSNFGFIRRLFGGLSRAKLDSLADKITQGYIRNYSKGSLSKLDPANTKYAGTNLFKNSDFSADITGPEIEKNQRFKKYTQEFNNGDTGGLTGVVGTPTQQDMFGIPDRDNSKDLNAYQWFANYINNRNKKNAKAIRDKHDILMTRTLVTPHKTKRK